MSTEFKSLERIDRAAAYEMQNRFNQVRIDATNAANQAREQAMRYSEAKINQFRQESIQREQQVINTLRSETNNKLAQQDAQHRAALLDMSGALQNQLNQQASDFRNRLSDVRAQNQNDINRLRTETNNLINNLASEVNKAFEIQNEVNRNHQAQINSVKNDVRNLQQNISDQISWAKENLANCRSNIVNMDNDIAINRFQGQELERVKKSVSNAETLINSAPQAAIGNLTEARLDLMEIREKAQISQAIFESLFEQSLSGIKSLIENIKHNKANTKMRDTNVDLTFWTNGKYTDFEQKVNKLENEVSNAMQNPAINIDGLTDIIQKISNLEFEEENLVVEAVRNIELSQNRVETADNIINQLQEKGNFIIKKEDDEGYVANDYREGYFATLVDRGNQEISITVMVDSVLDETDNSVKNKVCIQRNDDTHQNPALVEEYRDLIETTLQTDGSEVSRTSVPDEKIFDAKALKNTKLTKVQKERLKL
jgi:hypothetical protein